MGSIHCEDHRSKFFVIIGNSSPGRQITLYSKLAIELYSYNNIFKNLFKEK